MLLARLLGAPVSPRSVPGHRLVYCHPSAGVQGWARAESGPAAVLMQQRRAHKGTPPSCRTLHRMGARWRLTVHVSAPSTFDVVSVSVRVGSC